MVRKGAEEARNQLPDLLEAAARGRSTLITKHGKPVAALVPVDGRGVASRQESLLSLEGTGRGLWGSARKIQKLRDEWGN